MSALEAHPIAELDASGEELPEPSEPAPAAADEIPAENKAPVDDQDSSKVQADAPRASVAAAPLTSALPPKAPQSKLSPAEVHLHILFTNQDVLICWVLAAAALEISYWLIRFPTLGFPKF